MSIVNWWGKVQQKLKSKSLMFEAKLQSMHEKRTKHHGEVSTSMHIGNAAEILLKCVANSLTCAGCKLEATWGKVQQTSKDRKSSLQ